LSVSDEHFYAVYTVLLDPRMFLNVSDKSLQLPIIFIIENSPYLYLLNLAQCCRNTTSGIRWHWSLSKKTFFWLPCLHCPNVS